MTETAQWMMLGLGLAFLLACVVFVALRARRPTGTQFASDYARVVRDAGETAMAEPARPTRRFAVRPLGQADRRRYADAWRAIQIELMDEPGRACAHADLLVAEVMAARGYPMEEFERRSEDLIADHPTVIRNYGIAHDIAVRQDAATPAELSEAMAAFQVLVDELVGEAPLTDRVWSNRGR
jgi:protein-disulfide isomerase-like protein with CxxC motif